MENLMDNTCLKIAMAAFFHDLGKFSDSDVLDLPQGYIDDNAAAFLPSSKERHTHWHLLYTVGIIEKLAADFPRELNAETWGEGDAFIRLAAASPAPSSPMESIIALADQISSGMDRETVSKEAPDDCSVKDHQKNRLLPVFEHLTLDDAPLPLVSGNTRYQYPLKPLDPYTIFPESCTDKGSRQTDNEYRALFKGFIEQIPRLAHARENTALWFEHFDSLAREYTSAVPAAKGDKFIPDVSLYDHMRTTSALAAAIYLYHRTQDTLDIQSIENRDEEKFILISGDFTGIQNFIFSGHGESGKFRSKILRGRSFYVSLLTELTAALLCRTTGLPHTSVILNAGGRFTILAPNTGDTIQAVERVERQINDWLVDRTLGETAITLAQTSASCKDFESQNFSSLWDRLVNAADTVKYNKLDLDLYGGAVESYLDGFSNDLSPGLCPLCGKRAARPNVKVKDLHCCALCRDHIFIGENLVKHPVLMILDADGPFSTDRLEDPIFGKFQIHFQKQVDEALENPNQVFKYWDIGRRPGTSGARVTALHLNTYIPVYGSEDTLDKDAWDEEIEPGMPKTFNCIAGAARHNAHGTEALGVLKADVDHLGLLMSCGLRSELYTISRMACLSRQMNNFFALYLPQLLSETETFQNIYTVFAGGDDLFLIGPWNRIMELANGLEEKFSTYVCHNPDIRFSAGISLHKSHTPMNTLARSSETALEQSKHKGRNRITLFDRTVTWETFKTLTTIGEELAQWVDDEWISSVFLYKLNTFIDMALAEKTLLNDSPQGIPIQAMACTQWRSRLTYAVERNALLKLDPALRRERLTHIRKKTALWLDTHAGDLRIPLWTLQYNRR